MNYATYVLAVCKMGQGAACCRYLMFSPGKGFECAKMDKDGPVQSAEDKMKGRTPFKSAKELLDWRVATDQIVARGDNCEGKDPIPDEAPDEDRPF